MKSPSLRVVFIGAGNVATQLALTLKKHNHSIVQVYSKQLDNAKVLAQKLKSNYTNTFETIDATADLYIVAIKDDAIAELAKHLKLSNKLIVHTSGSVDMAVLKDISSAIGVFYPLQTFSKNKSVNFKQVPICIESNNTKSLKVLSVLAHSISDNVQQIDSEQRRAIHLAAVIACNFSNHMYAIAEQLLHSSHISLDILKPLIQETTNKIKTHSPAQVQTGPAIRNDRQTMNKHLKMLENNADVQKLYKQISKSILTFSKNKKQ